MVVLFDYTMLLGFCVSKVDVVDDDWKRIRPEFEERKIAYASNTLRGVVNYLPPFIKQ